MLDPASAEALRRRDEILQALYWMHGEGLGDLVRPDDLRRILGQPSTGGAGADTLDADLAALVASGLVTRGEAGVVTLSPEGRREGARRFADAFAGMTAQAHGECSDPECDCHDDPEAALDCHRERHGLAHS